MDVEGVELPCEKGLAKGGLGHVSIVTERGEVVLDVFVYYPQSVVVWTPDQRYIKGVTDGDILPENGARPVAEVLAAIERICAQSAGIICHSLAKEKHYVASAKLQGEGGQVIDIPGFELQAFQTFDTQKHAEYFAINPQCDGPALKKLAKKFLNRDIQGSEHCSIEDARATMDLFLCRRDAFKPTSVPKDTTKRTTDTGVLIDRTTVDTPSRVSTSTITIENEIQAAHGLDGADDLRVRSVVSLGTLDGADDLRVRSVEPLEYQKTRPFIVNLPKVSLTRLVFNSGHQARLPLVESQPLC